MPKRIQLKRTRGWRKPPETVVVSRPTKFGNPANWKKYSYLTEIDAKAMAVEWYREWIMGEMVGQYYPEQRQWILDHIHELTGKNLACWCKLCDRHKDGLPFGEHCPDCEPCHCQPLGELANKAALPPQGELSE